MPLAPPPPRDLVGSQTPTHRLTPRARHSRGAEAIELAEIVGIELDAWQRQLLIDGLGVQADGRWASFEVGVELARQNGKSVGLEVRALAGLFLFRERLVVYTAHKGETALEAFTRIDDLIDDSPELKAEVRRVVRTNGKESIELHTGQRIKFRTRTKGGGRGLSGDCVLLDEAQDLDDGHIAALLPTLRARPNPQLWYAGSAGGPHSTVLGRLIRRMGDKQPRLTMYRFAAAEDDPPGDWRTWAKTNPALGTRILLETVENEYRAMSLDKFCNELLGMGNYPREEGEDWVIPRSKWEGCEDLESKALDPVVFAVEVKWDRTAASIAMAGWRRDGARHVEVVRNDLGTRWVAAELAGLLSRHKNLGVVLDPGGPAGSLRADLADVGIEPVLLKTGDVTQAFGEFLDATTDERPGIRHRGAPVLTASLAAATTRRIGDATTWRRQSPDDVSPILAATWAAHALRSLQPKRDPAPPPRRARSAGRVRSETADLAHAAF